MARQVPRAVVRRARGDGDDDERRADRRHDRDRRLARLRDGRGRSLSTLTKRSRASARSTRRARGRGHAGAPARAGAVRLALARGAARGRGCARADACLLQVGRVVLRHVPPRSPSASTSSRSAPTSRARSTARSRCSRRSRRELGCAAGETTADGEVTLRTIECLGGCGWGTVVSVDHRYRHGVRPRTWRGSWRSSVAAAERGRRSTAPTNATTKLAEYEAVGGYARSRARAMTPEEMIDELLGSELRGRGGAFFSTGASGASSRRSRSRSRTTSSSTPTSRSPAASRTTRSWRASRTASSRAA